MMYSIHMCIRRPRLARVRAGRDPAALAGAVPARHLPGHSNNNNDKKKKENKKKHTTNNGIAE